MAVCLDAFIVCAYLSWPVFASGVQVCVPVCRDVQYGHVGFMEGEVKRVLFLPLQVSTLSKIAPVCLAPFLGVILVNDF